MQDLCPLCSKNGLKNKIKLLQINLQEAVWICEEEKCVWPFGYEDFVFCPRTVGKVWSCYWNDYKPTTPPRLKENLMTSSPSKLPLCFTPVIPTKHIPKEVINNLDMHPSENINATNNSSNIINSNTNFDDPHISVFKESSMISNINIEEKYNDTNTLNNETTVSNVHSNKLQSINDNIEDIKFENEWKNLLNEDIKEKNDISIENVKSMNTVKKAPKITSIEKTNIIISNMKIGNQIPNVKLRNEESVHQKSKKKILDVESVDVTGSELKPEVEELTNLEPSGNNENILKPNLNITTMEIDGLPPITLSFEIPLCSTAPETVIANTQLDSYKSNNTKPNSFEVKGTVVKRNISSGKIYEKFNFSAIKKKLESNSSSNTNNSKDNFSNVKTQIQKIENDSPEPKPISNESAICVSNELDKSYSSDMKIQVQQVKNDSPEIISNVSATCVQNQLDESVTPLSNQETIESNTAAVNASVNIDTVLEELICNDYSISENINDDWIESLLI
ncbi:probable E3 ubiquitin-protein ligase bre1 [Bombus vosnesenskii]|uniref:Probable E3 ubiquitin-protein ligase bre1 n=1 Tax=Bombus vosnesenskii TaxID=207650 RepID=A0A6J3KMD0_9HYME|nr:probable E3 ubiquitin-protein ligase bre1 [Bombus vosnesenskii]